MARLYISETDDLGRRDGSLVPIYKFDDNTVYQSVAIGTEAKASGTQKKYVRLSPGAACHVAINEDAVATAGSEVGVHLSAGQVLDLEAEEGDIISVIAQA